MSEFDLSILIVNWNGQAMLRNLLNSIDATRGNLRVQTIIADNASTDGSADMVAQEFPNILLIRNEKNAGFSKGNNQAAAIATAPLLLLLNNDTIVRSNALQKMVDFANAHPDTIAIGPKLIGKDGKTQHSVRNIPTMGAILNSIQFLRWTGIFRNASKKFKRSGWDENATHPAEHLMAAALLIRRDVFEQLGGFDEDYQFCPEDLDLCVRMIGKGKIYYLPEAEIDHLGRISARANRDWAYAAEKRGWVIYIRKHHGKFPAFLYRTAITLDAPIRAQALFFQWIIDSFRKDPERKKRSTELLVAATKFMFAGLPRFWRA